MAESLLGGVVINEILVDPNGSSNFDTDGNGTASNIDEFVELYNSSATAIDISGLEFWDAGRDNWFTFPSGTVLQPGAYATVITGVQAGGSLPTAGPNDLFFDAGLSSAVINNGADSVILLDPNANAGDGEYIQATFNGATPDDPTAGGSDYVGFPASATQVGSSEEFGNDGDGVSVQRSPDGGDSFATDTPTPGTANICFAAGCTLASPSGPVRIEDISVGDILLTADHGPQPVTWFWSKSWTPDDILANPALAPICITAGALGLGRPCSDMFLSQQHRVLVVGRIAMRMFGRGEVLIPAKALLELPGVYLDTPANGVTYFHVMVGQGHNVVYSNDMPTESLYLGAEALKALPPEGLSDLCNALGLTPKKLSMLAPKQPPARPLIPVQKAQKLVARHIKNTRAFVS